MSDVFYRPLRFHLRLVFVVVARREFSIDLYTSPLLLFYRHRTERLCNTRGSRVAHFRFLSRDSGANSSHHVATVALQWTSDPPVPLVRKSVARGPGVEGRRPVRHVGH
jgi:hypothetical protein